MRTKTETIIGALRVLAQDIQSEDGVSNAAIAEAADRIEELWSVVEKYADAGKICAQIYIARNITLSENEVLSALVEIDKLYREKNYN